MNGVLPKMDREGEYSSNKASEAVPNSQECEGRSVARVRTEEMLKPGQNGIGLDGLCRAWWVIPQVVGRRRRAVRNSRRWFVTMAFFQVTRYVNCKDRREGSRLLSQFYILLPFLIRSPTNFHVDEKAAEGARLNSRRWLDSFSNFFYTPACGCRSIK